MESSNPKITKDNSVLPKPNIQQLYKFIPLEKFELREYINSKNFTHLKRCEDHKVSFCEYFCLDCRIAICEHCHQGPHRKHFSVNKPLFLRNPELNAFNEVEQALSNSLNLTNLVEMKKKAFAEIETKHAAVVSILNLQKDKQLKEIENQFNKLNSHCTLISQNFKNSKDHFQSYLIDTADFYPEIYSDIMFLQGFNIINSGFQVVRNIEEHIYDFKKACASIENDIGETFNLLQQESEKIINSQLLKPDPLEKLDEINLKIQQLDDLISSNTEYNAAYLQQLELNKQNDNADYLFTKQFAFLTINGSPNKSVFRTGGSQIINSVKGNRVSMTKVSTPLNERELISQTDSYRRDTIRTSIDSSRRASQAKQRKSAARNSTSSSQAIKPEKRYDVRLFNLSYINFVNTKKFKWDNFISFSSTPNSQVLENKIINYASAHSKNKVNQHFLKLLESHKRNMEYDKLIKNGKLISSSRSKIVEKYYPETESTSYEDYVIKPIEGTNCINISTPTQIIKEEFNLEKVYKEYKEVNKANDSQQNGVTSEQTKSDILEPYKLFPFGIKTILIRSKVYFIGGKNQDQEFNTIMSYSFKNKELKFEANMINPRSYTSLIQDEDFIYILGGENNKTCEMFHIVDKSCHSLPSLIGPRANGYPYLYKNTMIYFISGFKSEIFKNETCESIERLTLRNETSVSLGLHKFYWEKVNFINNSGIDVLIDCYGILPITDNYIMLFGGYSNRKSKRILMMFDLVKLEMDILSPQMIKLLKEELLKSKEVIDLIDDFIEEKAII